MNYEKIYYDLCESRKYRGIKRESGYEVHHIIPKSCGGDDEEDNLVKLTYSEHFIAHKLLTKIYKGAPRLRMLSALVLMGCHKNLKYSRHFEEAKNLIFNRKVVVLYNFFLEEDINPVMISLNFQCKQLRFQKDISDMFKDTSNKKTKSNLEVLSKLIDDLYNNVLPVGDYFAVIFTRVKNGDTLKRVVRILISKGFLEKADFPEKAPTVYRIRGSFKELINTYANFCERRYITTPNTFDKKLHPLLKRSRVKLMVCKAAKSGAYIIYPYILSDILKLDERVFNLIGKSLTLSQIYDLLGYINRAGGDVNT